MRKIKFKQKTTKNRRWQKYLGLVCILGVILSSVVFLVSSFQEKEKVSAHPTSTIDIGSGNTEFKIPVDGEDKQEYLSGNYSDYKQTDIQIPSLSKLLSENEQAETKLFSSEIFNNIQKSYIVGEEKVISLQRFTSSPYSDGVQTYPVINQTRIILQNSKGDVLDDLWLHRDPKNIKAGLASGTDATFYNHLFQISDTEFLAVYTTVDASNQQFVTVTEITISGNVLSAGVEKIVNIPAQISLDHQEIQNSWTTNNGNILSAGVIYPYSTEKNYYNFIEHSGGFLNGLEKIQFEASSDVQNMSNQGTTFSNITDIYEINANTFIGIEEFYNNGVVTNWICKWEIDSNTKIASRTQIVEYSNTTSGIVKEISDTEYIYFQVYHNTHINEDRVEMIKISSNDSSMQMVKEFPEFSRLNFFREGSGYFYVGQIKNFTGTFTGIGNSEGVYSGYMDDEFNWKSSSFLPLDFGGNDSTMGIYDFVGNSNLYVISGYMPVEEYDFIDRVVYENYPGDRDGTGLNEKEWLEQSHSPIKGNSFVSILKRIDDWAPLIKVPTPLKVDITDSAIRDSNHPDHQSVLDNWLLTGSKNGTWNDPIAVKVYDTMDISDGLRIYSESWLRDRVNKNPKTLVYKPNNSEEIDLQDPIEWDKLGFNKDKTGPQTVTYFVTDSQNQTSTTSCLVNNVTTQTAEEGKYALDAQNFHIPLNSVDTSIPNADKFKELAKTMAWNTEDGTIDEDGTDASKLSGKVTIDATQLKALREAKVAKPYPVDVTYKPESGIEIKNRVWVFVTTKNTIPNSETNPAVTPRDTNGVVYYADDYSIPFRLRGTQDRDEVLTRGKVKVYDYFDSTHETAAELPTLADAGKNPNKLVVDLPLIQNALAPGVVTPSVSYTWDGATDGNHTTGTTTVGYLDVTLTGYALWHVRQVVLDASTEIVVPSKSYFDIQNVLDNSGSPAIDPNYRANLTGESGKLADNPVFTEVSIPTDHLPSINDQVQVSLVVPEFYQYVGYYWTTQQSDPQGASHQGNTSYTPGNLQLTKNTLNNDGEFWITLYIKPNTDDKGANKTPQPYSWDYKKNDLGKIKTK